MHLFSAKRRLPLNRRQTVYANGTLQMENLYREEDEGEYRCQVQDAIGQQAERTLYVRVLSK